MVDLSTSAVDLPIATDDHDAAAAPASDAGESSGGASAAAGALANDISLSAAPASLSDDIAATGAQRGDGPAFLTAPAMTQDEIAAATAAIVLAPATLMPLEADPTPAVSIDVEDHAEARERFAGLFVRLHGIEEDFVHALRNELNAIGTLLHLHSVASGKADATGDYSSSDLS
ncbi:MULTISPECIES: hypothetical protein [Burkholderia]|uniref:hypothetical protein n=1 Tax=Burkholderia TaxID=32008 RepID=UPI00158F542A|nr:hypothetical protein [Burkholderia ambifaria]